MEKVCLKNEKLYKFYLFKSHKQLKRYLNCGCYEDWLNHDSSNRPLTEIRIRQMIFFTKITIPQIIFYTNIMIRQIAICQTPNNHYSSTFFTKL